MINLLFTGDFAPCSRFEKYILQNRKNIFGDLLDDITDADISFVNLETPLCTNGNPILKSGPNICAHPDCIHAVAEAGFDIVGLANNHILDYGEKGLEETLAACHKAGLPTCGAGKNLQESQQPLVIEKKGLRIALIAVAEHEFSIAEADKPGAAPLDPIDNTLQIEKIRKEVDLLFVTIHGGNEYFPYPRPGLRKVCRFFIDRGADAVICHHSHVPGAYEFYKEKPIVYSLGNLIFDHPSPPKGWNQGYAVRLAYDCPTKKLHSYEIIPYTQSVEQGGVRKMESDDREAFLRVLEEYGQTLADEVLYQKVWDKFCEEKKVGVLFRMFLPFTFRGLGRLNRILSIEKLMLPDSCLLARKNMLKCESHLELMLTILSKRIKKQGINRII